VAARVDFSSDIIYARSTQLPGIINKGEGCITWYHTRGLFGLYSRTDFLQLLRGNTLHSREERGLDHIVPIIRARLYRRRIAAALPNIPEGGTHRQVE
jgi:hypothetical protein